MTGEKTRIRLGRETLIGLLGLVGMVCLAVGLTGLSFRSQFLPETVINGVDCTSLDPADAADRLLEQAGRETFSLEDARGEVILMGTLAELADRTALEEELAALQAQQQSERGFFAFLGREDFSLEVPLFAGQDQESLARWLEQRLYGQSPLVEPQDAYLSLEEDFWALVPEVTGNAVDIDKCAGALSALLEPEGHLTDGKEAYTVILSNARILPRVTTENPTLRKRVELLEDYLATEITLDFENGSAVQLTPEDIYAVSRIELSPDGILLEPEYDRVLALTQALAEEYASDGLERKYLHVAETRDTVYYRQGDWGFILDQDALAQDVCLALENRESGAVTPRYDYTSYLQDRYGVGNTVLEISIENQYMWYYLDGELLVETPVVTGCVSDWDITRTGVFQIYWKTTDTYLVGPTWNDHVDYWMPFDGQIGLHDSSWRDEYGGDIYLENGSHGCVNTPLEAIATIYENSWIGVPVIVYWEHP